MNQFTIESKQFTVVARTTDDFGYTTEVGIATDGTVAAHSYEYSDEFGKTDESYKVAKNNEVLVF